MSFLLFDAYGTLAELDDFYNRLQRGFAARGFDFPMDVVTHAAHREMRYYIQHSLRAHQNDEYVTLRAECAGIIADTIREHGHELPLSTDDVIEVLSDAIVFHLFPETRETLQALHERGVRMGVLSNWDYQLSGILEDLGIAHFFDFVLSSAGVGYEKPAPEFFALGLEEIRKVQPNIALSDCYYIG
ncbi:MAG TPA: HAD family hydrolase, partial [Abditibacteriaceae bacterium]